MTWINWNKKKEAQKKLFKTNHLINSLFFFVFNSSLSGKFLPQSDREYAPFAFLVYEWLNLNKRKSENLELWAPNWACIIRRVFGSWPEMHCTLYMPGQIPLKKAIRAPKLQRLVQWCYYVLLHMILRKKKEYAL